MTLASSERDHRRLLYAVPETHEQELVQERNSDAWPAFSTELSEAEIQALVEKNRPAYVFWQAMWVVVYSVGLVLLFRAI
jgi:hypothetical protein